jgi:hypothetical protein
MKQRNETRLPGAAKHMLFLAFLLLHCTAMAAEVDGRWKFVFETPAGVREGVMEMRSEGEDVVAKGPKHQLKGTYKEGVLELSGEVYSSEGGYSAKLTIKGAVKGNQIKGDAVWDQWTMPFTAKREE